MSSNNSRTSRPVSDLTREGRPVLTVQIPTQEVDALPSPENLEGPNKSEKKPTSVNSNTAKKLGGTAIKGANQK
jgi:hypothetical protein